MAAGVILDTSFLITLAGLERPHHSAARSYWRHFLDNQIPMFLSAIVVSEFCIRQEIPPDILRACIVLPFNWDHAIFAAKLDWKRVRPAGSPRDALKDDIKIIAQAAVVDAQFVITDDADSFHRFCQTFKSTQSVQFVSIKLEDGFDISHFTGGQREFGEDLGEPNEDSL